MKRTTIPCILGFSILVSCNGHDDKKPGNIIKDSGNVHYVISKKIKPAIVNKIPPIINIVDTISPKRIVLYFRDSAASYERISLKLARIYGVKLNDWFKKSTVKSTGQPMAWFLTKKPPYIFEAGIQVNIKPIKLPPGAKVRIMGADSAVIAHFYGPYDQLHMGYEAMDEWLTDHKKRRSGIPFEIYITDPIDKKGKPMDPFKVQTDIVMPRK